MSAFAKCWRPLGRARFYAALAAAWALSGGSAHAIYPLPTNFAEYGSSVSGYQDFFQTDELNSGWSSYGNGVWNQPGDGYLHAKSGTNDPTKLLYTGAAYNSTTQNVLAIINVTNFGANGDTGARAGITTVSDSVQGRGVDYIYYGNGNGIQKAEFLNDFIAHGPNTVSAARAIGTEYWVRMLHSPNKAAGGDPAFNNVNDVFAKIWPADGVTPEPTNYQYSWASNDTRSGLAGLMIGHDNFSTMEVGYTLIQASGLPSVNVGTYVPPEPPTPPTPTTGSGIGNYGQTVMNASPLAFWRLETNVTPPIDTASAAGFPQYGPQNGVYDHMDPNDLGQPGPRPTDVVNGQPLTGFSANNHAAHFQGQGKGGNDVALFADDGNLDLSTTNSFTVEAWVKGAPTQEGGAPILAKGEGLFEQFALDVVGNKYRFYVRNGANVADARVLQSTVGPDDTWQHVAAVYDGAEGLMRLYVNGVQAPGAIPVVPATIYSNLHAISVGARQSAGAGYDFNFNGLIDEVAVYKYALPEGDIQSHFQAAFVPEPSTMTLVGVGLAVVGARVVRKRRK